MLLKFLFGLYRVTDPANDEKDVLKDCLFMFRKTDVLQHSDVKSAFGLIPSNGGFIRKLRSIEKMDLYGESVSCSVGTDQSMMEIYEPLLKEGSWWEAEYTQHGSKYTIWAVVPEGLKPNLTHCKYEFKPSSHKNMYDTMSAEEKTGYGW